MKKIIMIVTAMFFLLALPSMKASAQKYEPTIKIPSGEAFTILLPGYAKVGDKFSVNFSANGNYNYSRVVIGGRETPYVTESNVVRKFEFLLTQSDLDNGIKIKAFLPGVIVTVYEYKVNDKYAEPINHLPVTSVDYTKNHNSISLTWGNPDSKDFTGVAIYLDGVKLVDVGQPVNNYKINSLQPEREYKVEVFANYSDGMKSEPITTYVTTDKLPQPVGDVRNLSAKADHDRVDLSWSLPNSERLKHVNIYRYEVQQTALIDKVFMIKTASAATGKKIFETNGTYFNDLTVNPETTYQYTLTTTSTDLIESVGVSKTVTTPKKPTPEIEGGEFEKDPATGSYIYKWTEPTTGKVKVMVGGKLYTTVNAANKVIVIPAKDMKYKGLDEPDVYLIPVSEDGEEGVPVKPPAVGGGTGGMLDKVDLPFNAGELLGTGTGLFWVIGPFVLLSLAFLLVPKLRNFVVQAFTSNKDVSDDERRSRNDTERVREERLRAAREREVNVSREPVERQQRAVRASRERVHKARMTREERRTT